jgi:GT2 family glycosyltransferase
MGTVFVVVPNWNGGKKLSKCIDSLLAQSLEANMIVVDNASSDESVKLMEEDYPQVILIKNKRNLGFAGGVNTGIKYALASSAKYIALLNNDAAADKDWLKNLADFMDSHSSAGIATSKIIDASGKNLDSTGEMYSLWGLPYPRGRGEPTDDKYDNDTWVFGASGGASIYRAKMFNEIGLFDKDFFLYYEDVDLSFRAQLAGWKVAYVPSAVVHHEIGASAGPIKGLTTYQTMKNLPMLFWKNVPWGLMPKMLLRFKLAYLAILLSAVRRGQGGAALRGVGRYLLLIPKKTIQRRLIQRKRKMSPEYLETIIAHDLPPGAARLRALRAGWWKLRGKSA